jgi:hypothetical protein
MRRFFLEEKNILELVIENIHEQIAELICQLTIVRSLRDHEKSDNEFMINFKNFFLET